MATRNENINTIRAKLAQADREIDTLTDEQLDKIVGGSDYTYGEKPRFIVGERVIVRLPISGFWESMIYVVTGQYLGENFCGVITCYTKKDGKWIYDIMTSDGVEHENIDEMYIACLAV